MSKRQITMIKQFLIGFSTLVFLIACNQSPIKTTEQAPPLSKQPNFLFIAVDDLNIYSSVLGEQPDSFLRKVYPDPALRADVLKRLTPNLQELAQSAITFDQAYTASPLCGPSRTALLTGVPTHLSGYYQHEKHFRYFDTLKDIITLPQYLKSNGYYTTGIGKVFHKGRAYLDRGVFSDWPDMQYSWDQWIEAYTGAGGKPNKGMAEQEVLSKYWPAPKQASKQFMRFGTTNVPTENSWDYQNAQWGAELINQGRATRQDLHGKTITTILPSDQPWFVAVGIFAPHQPWVVEKKYQELFPTDEMQITPELRQWVLDSLKDLSTLGLDKVSKTYFESMLEHGIQLDGAGGDINAWKSFFQAYLATIAFSDQTIGVLVDGIKKNPQANNTVVVLWSDHGYHEGDKNPEGKTTLWEAANHCNMMILDPRRKSASSGLHSQAQVSLQDLYPTVVSLAGLERPEHVHGYDLTPLLDNPAQMWDKPVLATFGANNHAVRYQNYRYIRFSDGGQELYDLTADPHEFTNLAKQSAYQGKLTEFSQRLEILLAMKPADYE